MTRVIDRERQLERPSDFVHTALRTPGASVEPGHGSRKKVHYHGVTIGFSDHGNKPYSPQYRRLLIKAFRAAGLLAVIAATILMVLQWT